VPHLNNAPVKFSSEEGNDDFGSQAGNRVAVAILAALVVGQERVCKGDGVPVFHAGFLLLLAVVAAMFDAVVAASKDVAGTGYVVFGAPRCLRLCKVTQEEDDPEASV